MATAKTIGAFHYSGVLANYSGIATMAAAGGGGYQQVDNFTYTFQNFFHPYVSALIQKLNQTSVAGMLDPAFLQTLHAEFFPETYTPLDTTSLVGSAVNVVYFDKTIDLTTGGPYANYNWELLYHIPVMIAVHLSSNQRFAEAQKWFHLVFDPTSTDQSVPSPDRFWKFIGFRNGGPIPDLGTLLTLLSTPDSQLTGQPDKIALKQSVRTGYDAIRANPFHPHLVARTRPQAYQWYVVMKYLDNLIAWGDSLFLQDTVETLNEATLCYVLAADLLGPRPQALPPRGTVSPRTFSQLKAAGLDAMSNAMIELEGQFPFNLTPAPAPNGGADDQSGALFGIGRSLYFCIPPNQTLLAYWDTVADRLFKIRNSENIQGVVQQLPLFDPPLDPGMLVKAAAAGLDIGSVVSGLNQPASPIRSLFLIQKALEIAGEVRSLGASLLSAIEKGDAEQLALLRQSHEISLQQLSQNVRFLQWRQAQASTDALLKTRASALERYTYYLRLLGQTPDAATVPQTPALDRRELTEANFDDAYDALVGTYNQSVALQPFPPLKLAGANAPSNQSGASGAGALYLNTNEDAELNSHLPTARDTRLAAGIGNTIGGVLAAIPDFNVNLHWWGIGASSKIVGGLSLSLAVKLAADVLQIVSGYEQDQAGIASRTASYQRRADDWTLQANLAARELMQIGRQILGGLLAEQIAYHDYTNVKAQVQQAQDVQSFLQDKFTNRDFYTWMQSGVSALYYQYYRFACDTARKAEQTMKRELMRPELDATSFVQFNYWDAGHRGLLSGEALQLDIKRMELAYHDNNKRELELTRHVSLRQLDPLALLKLKITGACTVDVPEWLFDRDCPGHYMRRIKSVAVSVPSVVGPYASVNCTLNLQRSTVRISSLLSNGGYARDTSQDDPRFTDYFGSVDTIVTSSGVNDSGLFDLNLRDDRFLPFEGAGADSTWSLALPTDLRSFDYMTISDVILHIRYTARPGGGALAAAATSTLKTALATAGASAQALLFCLRYDFPTEWAAFVNGAGAFQAQLQKMMFPYGVQGGTITIDGLTLLTANAGKVAQESPAGVDLSGLNGQLNGSAAAASLSLAADTFLTRQASQLVFLVVQYHFTP